MSRSRLENAKTITSELTQTDTAVNTNSSNSTDALDATLEIFDFSIQLPKKLEGVMRLFYNNCNGIEINTTIGSYLKQKSERKRYNYLTDIEVPTKLDGILRQMKLWDVDVTALSEICVAWEEVAPRRVIQQITKQYDRTACWTVASSSIKVGSYLKPGGQEL